MIRYFCYVCLLLLGLSGFVRSGFAEEAVNLKGVMILATNDDGPSDKSIHAYETQLKRLFKFKHYQRIGNGDSRVNLPGETRMELDNQHSLEVKASVTQRGHYRLLIDWHKNNQLLLKTTLIAKKGVPTLLGGPRYQGGNLIVVIVAK